MRKSKELTSRLGELEEEIEMTIFHHLRAHESLEDELISLDGEQVSVYYGELADGVRAVIVVGKSPGIHEGSEPLRDLDVNKQLDILESIEDILRED